MNFLDSGQSASAHCCFVLQLIIGIKAAYLYVAMMQTRKSVCFWIWGLQLVMLRDYSWLSTQGSLPTGSGDLLYVMLGNEHISLHASPVPCPLNYCSCLPRSLILSERQQDIFIQHGRVSGLKYLFNQIHKVFTFIFLLKRITMNQCLLKDSQ